MLKKKDTITIPESYSRQKLSALYKELPISDDIVKLLRKYLKAMANLYGILPIVHVYEIIAEQNPGLLTKADFVKYITLARHEQEYFILLGESDLYKTNKHHSTASLNGILINLLYVGMGDAYIDRLAELQGNKPYYVLEKNVLLRNHDCNYTEPTPYTRAMKQFWHETIHYS